MFLIRLSPTFSASDSIEDIELPDVPAVGDLIRIEAESRNDVVTYRVLARQFEVSFFKGKQSGAAKPRALLHVENA